MSLKSAAVFFGLMCVGSAGADSLLSTGTITAVRTYSLKHGVIAARGVTIVQLSQPLTGGCAWAFIDPADKASLANTLAAKASVSPVVLWYDAAQPSPWGDSGICALTGLEVN